MLTIHGIRDLQGVIRVPGDKSISHRAVMLASLAAGTSTIQGFLAGDDCLSTIACFRKLGVVIEQNGSTVMVHGRGLDGLEEPDDVLDAGNSGTTMRLLSGVLAGQKFLSVVTGDQSLRSRPMQRIAEPLRQMGAFVDGRHNGTRAPLILRGGELRGIDYTLPVASAQIKSAVLLAGLFADGETAVTGDAGSRDHTENMLAAFGVPVDRTEKRIVLRSAPLSAVSLQVPGDISSAAFFLAAAAALPGSDVTVTGVGLNPTRSGILDVLRAMGADVEEQNIRHSGGEAYGDIRVRGRGLQAVSIGGSLIPRLIDEIPVIAVAAALAQGVTTIRDAAELKVKESNRIAAMVSQLRTLGVRIEERPDGMEIRGPNLLRGGTVDSFGDHRIAMSLAVAGLFAREPVQLKGDDCIAVSYPGFVETMQQLQGKSAQC